VFYHFVGAVPLSTSLSDMLQRLLGDLCDVSRGRNQFNFADIVLMLLLISSVTTLFES